VFNQRQELDELGETGSIHTLSENQRQNFAPQDELRLSRRFSVGHAEQCPRETLRQVSLIGLAIKTFALGQANAQSTKELPPRK